MAAYLRDLEHSQSWPLERLRTLQAQKLSRLLQHARTRCPFYRQRLDDAAIDPSRVDLDALGRIQPLTRQDVATHMPAMIDPQVRGGLHRVTTGGSTGEPLIFCMDRRRQAADQAARARTRRWFGIDIGERELYLWGSPVEHSAQDWVKRVRDRLTNHRLLNAFRMTPRRMSQYLAVIERYDPVHIFGYPSSIARLCRHAGNTRGVIQTPSLRAVFVTGELFLPEDRAVIEETVAVPVADGYGARDAGFIAHQCPAGAYHVTMESVIVELLDTAGGPVPNGQTGEVTITHLDAYGMPFIRYRTGDLARRGQSPCPCGRELETLERIEGRSTDMLRTADGGHAHALAAIYVLREEPAVAQFRVRQRPNLDLDVTIVPRAAYDDDCGARIRRGLRRQIGGDIEVRINSVDEIPPSPSGKHRFVETEAE